MGKFCTSCGTTLNEGAKFCAKCGANTTFVSVGPVAETEQVQTNGDVPLSKTGENLIKEAQIKGADYAQSLVSDRTLAAGVAGEFVLPLGGASFSGRPAAESLTAILRSGFTGLVGGFKRTLGDKKRLAIAIALVVAWLALNFLTAVGISPLPVRVLSGLTAAQGSLIGGSIGKGLVAALLAQVIIDKSLLQGIKVGLGQIKSGLRGGISSNASLLFGSGVALIVCNLMVSSSWQNIMVAIAGFALGAKALTINGFLSQLVSALLPKATRSAVTALMGGWALGFALFAVISLIPGNKNGILLGVLLLIIGGVMMIVNRSKQEVAAQ